MFPNLTGSVSIYTSLRDRLGFTMGTKWIPSAGLA